MITFILFSWIFLLAMVMRSLAIAIKDTPLHHLYEVRHYQHIAYLFHGRGKK